MILTACSPYGLQENPNQKSDENNNSTADELSAMDSMEEFPVTIGEFEEKIQLQNEDHLLIETDSGYTMKDDWIQIDYKNESSDKSEPIMYIYIFINQENKKFNLLEKEFSQISERIFTSLDVTYDVDELVKSIYENKIDAMHTEDTVVELTNNSENIQMIISPK